jgi:Prolyl oligopeptidase family/Dipeptidyl peptidase IV (DPP IV) N-terminal region
MRVFCVAMGAVIAVLASSEIVLADSAPNGSLLEAGSVRDTGNAPYQRGRRRRRAVGVYKARITPHWFAKNTQFWYRNALRGGKSEFILVDAEHGKRSPAFDHAKLAASLSKAAKQKYQADRLPFDRIEFSEKQKSVLFSVRGTEWECDLSTYECRQAKKTTSAGKLGPDVVADEPRPVSNIWPDRLAPDAAVRQTGNVAFLQPRRRRRRFSQTPESPDGKWEAFIRNDNVFIRSTGGKQEFQLSKDGREGNAYGMLNWSPDSKSLVAFRIEPGEPKEVYLIESSPRGGGRAKLRTRPYALPGDKFPAHEPNIFHVADKKQIKPKVDRIDFGFPRVHWKKDGRHFWYRKVDRGHQRLRVVDVDAETGKSRNLIDEKSTTFIWTAHGGRPFLNYLAKTDEFIYGSERDGWHHLYLIDGKAGTLKHQITKGEYVVRGIDRIDEEKREIWFRASGWHPFQDPYFIHYYRVTFDGSDLVALTEGDGNHSLQFSPDRKYLIDTYSRVDMPPVNELRRVTDGKLLCELERADITELKARGWKPPEVFVAKGRDGKTDIWGLIHRPRNLDPKKKYPVIESIYAGPHGSFVPKSFSALDRFRSLTDLGFIVVQMDGMGTANRSKAFHDVCWHNLKDAGFPDRILWHKAAAKKYPYMDISRVGIYGTSAGGQSAMGAVLFHGDFYKAAVAACGCHDNRMDKASWNEQWMGYPVGPHYAACSNVDNAWRLKGKLLLIVGELDTNVPPESTMRVVDALIKAGKDFDLLVIPGAGHTSGGRYGARRLQDFFVRHLQRKEPPDRNKEPRRR